MKTKRSMQVALAIWRGIVRFQLRARMTTLLSGLEAGKASQELSFTEGLALHIIATADEAMVKDVAATMQLERSWVSRLLSALERKGAIKSVAVAGDGRAKALRILPAGVQLLKNLNETRAALMTSLLASLNKKEQQELYRTLKALADGFGAPAYAGAFNPHPIDFELARLSWGIGVAGNNFIGTGINVSHYHLLMVLAAQLRTAPVSIKEVHAKLPIDMSTLSRAIDSLGTESVLEKVQATDDKRSYTVRLTAEGLKTFQRYEENAALQCAEALTSVAVEQQEHLAQLLERLTEETLDRSKHTSGSRLEVQQANIKSHATEAREFLAQNSVKSGDSLNRTAKGALQRFTCRRFICRKDSEVCAVAEVVLGDSVSQPSQITLTAVSLSLSDCIEFLTRCISRDN